MFQQIKLEYSGLRRADALYAPSDFVASRVAKSLDRPVEVLRTPFFLGHESYGREHGRESLRGRRFLLFFGLLNRLKGVPVIAEALPPLLTRNPDLDFVFVGKEQGPASCRTMQTHVLNIAGDLRHRIHFLGELPHAELYPLIRKATAIVLPSLVDNLPNACLEAMALGQVVVGTRGTSFDELIVDGVDGVLCQPGNPTALEGALERVLALSENERFAITRQAIERSKQFEPGRTIPPLVAFYENVIQQSRHSAVKRGV